MTQRWPLVLLLGSVVVAVGCTAPSSGAVKDGNAWSDNRWSDGPYADQFLYPDNSTHPTEF